jgi:dCMP deaminase
MDDLQFIAGPAAADVDGDGVAEIVAGSGGFLVRAYDDAGLPVEGWPKFTGQWVIATPAVGDLDGDGLLEVAVMTRKGLLYVWETPAGACGAAPETAWRTFHHDGQRTGVFEKDTVRPAAAREFKAERRRGRLELSWLAVGDNGLCGAASSYEIRGSSSGVPPAWADAVPVVTAEASKPAGAPMGLAHCLEIGCLREKLGVPSGERHELCRGLHAEQNALLQAAKIGVSCDGATMYVTCQPCNMCAKMIINAGIAKVIYEGDYPDEFSLELFRQSHTEVFIFRNGTLNHLELGD